MATHRADDPPLMKVSREIPLPWLVGIAFGLVVQAVTMWVAQQNQQQAIRDMTIELKELRTAAGNGGLAVERMAGEINALKVRVDGIDRRLQVTEQRKP